VTLYVQLNLVITNGHLQGTKIFVSVPNDSLLHNHSRLYTNHGYNEQKWQVTLFVQLNLVITTAHLQGTKNLYIYRSQMTLY
jgi:hypothetical protein